MRPSTGGRVGKRNGGREPVERNALRQIVRTIYFHIAEAGIGHAPLLCRLRPPCVLQRRPGTSITDLRISVGTSGCFDQPEPLLNIAVASIDPLTKRVVKRLMNIGIDTASGELYGARIHDAQSTFNFEYDREGVVAAIKITDCAGVITFEGNLEKAKKSEQFHVVENNLLHFLQDFAAKLSPTKSQERSP